MVARRGDEEAVSRVAMQLIADSYRVGDDACVELQDGKGRVRLELLNP